MANFVQTANRICRVVRLRRTLLNWLEKAKFSSRRGGATSGVPSGHVAVYVGGSSRRFVVRATYLNHPLFVKLLTEAEEEFGFDPNGPLKIPCDESAFEDAIRIVSGSVVDIIHRVRREEFPPLLQGFVQQPVC